MSDFVIIYRIEHSGCPVGDAHHGPHYTNKDHIVNGSYVSWFVSAPNFGSCGPEPQNDRPPLPVGEGLRCGCLRNQVSGWWSMEPPVYQPKEWSFAVYKVPVHLAHVGARQVVFPDPPLSIFLGYFPGWVNDHGELDDRWPDSAFLQPNSRVAVSTPPTVAEPPLHKDSIDTLRSEAILKSVGTVRSGFTFPPSSWINNMSA